MSPRCVLLLWLPVLTACPGVLSGGAPLGQDQSAPWGDSGVTPLSDAPPLLDSGPTTSDGTQVQPDGQGSAVWRPKPGTTWHWQLVGTVDQTVQAQMYDIDLFDNSAATIAAIKAKGRAVICYFSAGSLEGWRPDAKDFPQAVQGEQMDGWNEQWLDVRAAAVRAVMIKRIELARTKGCDGVEPDNVDGYANDSGFPLTAADQLDYNKFLASEAHKRGLSVGLKNDLGQIKELEPYFDWALNEECVEYGECDQLVPFIQAGKAVFHVEYPPATKSSVCPKVVPMKFDSQIKNLNVDAWYLACWS